MRAWTHAIAFVVALLLGSGVTMADAPSGAAANDGAAVAVDADSASQAGDATGDTTSAPARRDLSELARQLTQGRETVRPAEDSQHARAEAPRSGEAASSAGTTTQAGESESLALGADNERRPLRSPSGDTEDPASSGSPFAGTGSVTLNTLTALGIVLGLIFLLRWVWTRLSGQPTVGSSPVIEVLARTPVAPRNHVLLVRVGNRILIVGDSSAGLRTLAAVEDPDEIADLLTAVTASQESSISRGFNQLLGRYHGEYEADDGLADGPRFADEGGDRSEHVVDRARDSMNGLLSRLRVMAGKGDGR